MSRRLHLLDATYELFRAYHSMPPLRAPDGTNVGAVRGLLGSTLRLLEQPDVTHLACATDHVIRSWRNRELDGYKTGEGIEPDLLAQFPLAEDGLRAIGCVVWPMVEFEADDAVSTAVARYRDDFDAFVVCSPDKDFAQLVDDQVSLFDRRKRVAMDAGGVREKFGVSPESIPDYLALVGDAADGLPGIRSWGARSTAAVLRVYGHIEAIPDDPADWTVEVRGAARLAANLAPNREAALLYRRLATLRTDVPLTEQADDLAWRGPTGDLAAFAARLGDSRLTERAAEVYASFTRAK